MEANRVQDFWKVYGEQQDKLADKKIQWFRHIILAGASLFGVIIALRPETSNMNDCANYCFNFAISLLALGILFVAIRLYGEIHQQKKLMHKYWDETKKAIVNNLPSQNVQVGLGKIFIFAEIVGHLFLIFAVISLATYTWLL